MPAFKIASGDLTNIPFLKKVARKKKPIILSTGMATLEEVRESVEAIKKQGNSKIILLHCTTNYPCPFEEVNLRAMVTLKNEFRLLVGYSDHTIGVTVPTMAVAIGACVIEKHFTLDTKLPGPDHKASLDPDGLRAMVQAIRNAEEALGDGVKKPNPSEQQIKKVARKSIVARIDIAKGAKISRSMVIVKRPGTGMAPKMITYALGKKTRRALKKDTLLSWEDLQ